MRRSAAGPPLLRQGGVQTSSLARRLWSLARGCPRGLIYPDDPSSYPCAQVGGRIGTSGWSLVGARYGHTRDLVLSFVHVLPSGEVVRIGDGGAPKASKSSSGYSLKQLFMGHQGTLGVATEATLKLYRKPEAEFSAFWAFSDFDTAHATLGELTRADVATFAGGVLFDEHKVEFLRRDDEAYIPQPESVKCLVCVAAYGNEDEVAAGAKRLLRIAKGRGARYLGDAISQGDWASRHDRYATPLHGRALDGQAVPMSWHCEDAALNYSQLPVVREKWHAIVKRYREEYGIFDDWGMFAYTSGANRPWGDYLVEIDVGIWEQRLDERGWQAWVNCKREISEVTLEHGGSITACHGATREGDADLVPTEMGDAWPVVLAIKRALDPNNVMNPGKQRFDEAYEEVV